MSKDPVTYRYELICMGCGHKRQGEMTSDNTDLDPTCMGCGRTLTIDPDRLRMPSQKSGRALRRALRSEEHTPKVTIRGIPG